MPRRSIQSYNACRRVAHLSEDYLSFLLIPAAPNGHAENEERVRVCRSCEEAGRETLAASLIRQSGRRYRTGKGKSAGETTAAPTNENRPRIE